MLVVNKDSLLSVRLFVIQDLKPVGCKQGQSVKRTSVCDTGPQAHWL